MFTIAASIVLQLAGYLDISFLF